MVKNWFHVDQLDSSTYRIHEPYYWQANNEYLLIGTERALLFDSGPGRRDILPIVRGLTDLPLLVLASHSHYDHIGNHRRLKQLAEARILSADIPATKSMTIAQEICPPLTARLSLLPRPFMVDEWLPRGGSIDLGNRSVEMIELPGHTSDSVGIIDRSQGFVFVGDFIYNGARKSEATFLLGALPTSDAVDYLRSSRRLREIRDGARILGGHCDAEVDPRRLDDLVAALENAMSSDARRSLLPFSVVNSGGTSLVVSSRQIRTASNGHQSR
ncbi:MBL fold metallo-hydrolase [Brevibacterium linens]|uniref:MBL fold metallo-hydrolase n=1 Tax=Brevibacterium linens TaxID=1703 RepID=UPI003BF50119